MIGVPVQSGDKVGRLTVKGILEKSRWGPRWECTCSCGNVAYVRELDLRRENTKSCGCLRSEATADRNRKRHTSKSKENE